MPLSLSERCLAIAPSATLAIDARAKELAAQGRDIIGFGAGEPDYDTPDNIADAAREAIGLKLTRYTPVPGTLALRQRICEKFKRDNGLTYAPDEVIVSSGAKQSLYHALCAIINPGDEVLLPAPCWVSYPEMVRMTGGAPVLVPGEEGDNFAVSANDIQKYVSPRTKALIINSPNNPAGYVLSRDALEGIARLAVSAGFYVISDEIYEKLVYAGEHVSIASLGDDIKAQSVVVNGVSKTYAMTGWRIGYAAGPKPVISAMSNYQSHSSSNANSIAQYASQAALSGSQARVDEMAAEFDRRRRVMVGMINDIPGLSANMPEGAFYVMMNIGALFGRKIYGRVIDSASTFAEALLNEEGVAVVPGEAFEAPKHVRVSYAVSSGHIAGGLNRIRSFVNKLES